MICLKTENNNQMLKYFFVLALLGSALTQEDQEMAQNNEDFFEALVGAPGTEKDHLEFDYFNFHEYNMMVDRVTTETIRVQTDWFTKNEIDSVAILNTINFSSIMPHQEITSTPVTSVINGLLQVHATKADQWCFLRFNQGSQFDVSFFFACSDQITKGNENIVLRKMDENCPLPDIKEESPPVLEICYNQQKRGLDIVSHMIEAYGEPSAIGALDCYIKVTAKIERADVETMCSKEAILQGWSKITQTEIETLRSRAVNETTYTDQNANKVTNFDMGTNTVTDTVRAR